MSMNQRYSSDNPWWITQQEHQHQFMSMQPPHNPTDSFRSDHSWPSQRYHPQQALLNLPNLRDSHTAFSSEHHHQTTSPSFNLNQEEDDDDEDSSHNPTTQEDPYKDERQDVIPEGKEPMFEKQLTPSDVGKLNRLVIPKQHAEKYFPLSGETAEHKGLVLSFEDERGKCWRFRYSYWNSSQSYVLTKGWSRYVKEKRLDAGDVILFERDPNDSQRIFICCKLRRQHSESVVAHVSISADNMDIHSVRSDDGVGMTRVFYPAHPCPTRHHPSPNQPECLHAGRGTQVDSGRKSVGSSSSKVLRLFGVNMECQPENGSEVPTPSMSSCGSAIHLQYDYKQPSYHPQTTHEHMVFTVHGDVNQTRNGRGYKDLRM